MSVVDLKTRRPKRRKHAPRDLPLDKASGSARFFQRMIRDVEGDLGGRRHLSRIEGELIRAFCGAATALQYWNLQLAIGEISEVDLSGYAHMASTMLRLGSRLGLSRRQIDVGESLASFIDSGNWTGDEEGAPPEPIDAEAVGDRP